jgi:hypothetical protein
MVFGSSFSAASMIRASDRPWKNFLPRAPWAEDRGAAGESQFEAG